MFSFRQPLSLSQIIRTLWPAVGKLRSTRRTKRSRAEILELRTLLSVATWDGDAGDGLWSTAENWSDDVLPAETDDVVIPDMPGVQTIVVNVNTTVQSVTAVENITVQNQQTLTVTAGVSQVSGEFTVKRGATLIADGSATFTPMGTIAINGASLAARNGGALLFGGLVLDGRGGLDRSDRDRQPD
jgi:hypothetical protein